MNNKVTFRSGLSMAVLSFVFVALLGVQGFAQAGTSTVAGTIFNEQNEVVPGATVTLVSVAQNTRRTAVTNSQGNYSFSLVNPGPYKIEVEAQGFKRAVTSEFQALVDKTTQLPITLEVGGVDVTVTVDTGGIENIVNTQDASLGNNFVSEQIVQLPLEGRNVGDLLSLQAAVTPDGSVAGGRSDQANITLDGIDVNEQQNGPAFTPVLRVTPDSIEEFRVTTSNPDASRGRSSGAQIALVTKAGSNQFRGALYEYHRNTVTTANSYFNNLAGIERPKLIRNLFGGSIGGPIVKDRVFFFYNYEGMRESKEVSVNRLVPLASMGQGQLRYQNTAGQNVTLSLAQLNSLVVPAGGTAPGDVVDMNPLTIALFQSAASRYVANNFQIGDGFNTGGFRFNAPLPVELNTHTARFDWKVTSDEKHTISVRGNYQQDLFANAPAFPDTPGTDTWSHPLGFQVSHTWLISNNLTNRFSYGLTRNAFSDQGDSADNAITFRDVFSPALFARTFSRVTPVQNITNDVNWITGDHTFQFGVNFRIIRNKRTSFAAAFDNGVANSSFYAGAGADLTRAIDNLGAGFEVAPALRLSIQRALTGLIGRLSQYGANFNFRLDGQPQGAGTPVVREWAAEEYDFYAQDSWKIRPNFTLNLGIRYGLSTPVYETQGFQAKPNITLSEYLQRRIDAAEQGQNYTEPLQVILAGKANNAPGFYKMDWDNWQPRISAAWSPNFKSGWLGTIFGTNSESVIRGGFAITNDYFGQALAVNFDGNNRLGFSSNQTISANTYNITTNPAPLYTGSGMAIRTLPGITVPAAATFPQQQPFNDSRRIEGSLDDDLVSPINYSWNVSLGRRMPWGMYVEASYVGRLARNLLAARDVMAPNNLRDPVSGQTYYEAAQALEWHRRNGTPVTQVPNQPFFENMYAPGSLDALFFGTGLSNSRAVYGIMANSRSPGCEPTNPITFGCYEFGTDWTFLQDVFDRFTGNRYFYQRQYGALSAYGTIGSSDYHGATLSVRQRYKGLTWDLNYTFSKSIDDASGLQTSGVYGTAFILNPLRQEDNKAVSDFDLRHVVNVNAIWDVPIGRGRTFFSGMNKIADAFLGGWQFSSIYRWNTGYPSGPYFDVAGWPTNWNVRSNMVQLRPISQTPSRTSGTGGVPNAYTNRLAAYRAFRSPAPGESGDRNQLREPDFWVMDMGLQKAFNMPWNENHKIKIRWDVFNVTNSVQFFGNADPTFGLDPDIVGAPGPSFGNYVGTQGPARVMQFAFRYEF
ncbi:MAG: TonB-dependent receptor [Acidobacteria bacterium]|nr:TonB-dependent receptor [Acidobacteriota bacterium]